MAAGNTLREKTLICIHVARDYYFRYSPASCANDLKANKCKLTMGTSQDEGYGLMTKHVDESFMIYSVSIFVSCFQARLTPGLGVPHPWGISFKL